MPARIQRQRTKGWRKPPGAISVTRRGPWGNEFKKGLDGTPAECVRKFEAKYQDDPVYQSKVRRGLRGKTLMCWCTVGAPCHGDVLLRWANRRTRCPQIS